MNVSATFGEPVIGTTLPKGPHQESWYVSVRHPDSSCALDLRFTLLVSQNGFRRIAETRAIFFQRSSGRESRKTAVKETFDLKNYSTALNREGFQIGDCGLSELKTYGKILSKGNSIEWDLQMVPRQSTEFDLVPATLKKMKLVRHEVLTSHPDLLFSGTVRVNGETFQFNEAPGMQGHQSGARGGHSGIHGHCNVFKNEQGPSAPFVFEGLSMKNYVLGAIPGPKLSSFYFLYRGEKYHFDSMRDSLRLKSRHTLNEWIFQAERGDLLFKGRGKVEHKDFAGLTFDDTNGSLIYSATSKFSDLEIQIYRRGKIETALHAEKNASIEIFSRKQSPYVPTLI